MHAWSWMISGYSSFVAGSFLMSQDTSGMSQDTSGMSQDTFCVSHHTSCLPRNTFEVTHVAARKQENEVGWFGTKRETPF